MTAKARTTATYDDMGAPVEKKKPAKQAAGKAKFKPQSAARISANKKAKAARHAKRMAKKHENSTIAENIRREKRAADVEARQHALEMREQRRKALAAENAANLARQKAEVAAAKAARKAAKV